ncbi:uncharacterized protein PHACADRAFT_246473 [Phanerochaete carnosa HHB-10118-sp]|uniref:Uncharacterized protein n=1 Tax=Phanerochaete carnosa (strain HHB-10118-sp) TaxID=650164 RepID=K5WMQ9_PHACS|nr:uncharacterized protein PHACADRAFT_246473 [Phanerochaete carnosa HHB-10118-sp]EKM60489.1 hypothetical protein PHACADRAFT_246473 [Phanerochaete carnosa HHB-10118-sp]
MGTGHSLRPPSPQIARSAMRRFSTYSAQRTIIFRLWCRTEPRWEDRGDAFRRGRLLSVEEQERVRRLLPATDGAGILRFI